MKLKIFFSLVICTAITLAAKSQGINFSSAKSWDEIKAQAKSEDKFIFMDIYATWCHPCRVMDEDIYPSKYVGDFFNQHFISVKVQQDSSDKDNPNIKSWYSDARMISNQYQISVLPSFLIFSPSGQLIHKFKGFKSEEELVSEANTVFDTANRFDLKLIEYCA